VIPLSDDNPTSRPAVLTILIIVACTAIYFLWQPTPLQDDLSDISFDIRHAAIPFELRERRPLTILEVAQAFGTAPARATCDLHGVETTRTSCVPGKSVWLSVLTSMFLHGSLLHLGGNMLFLWVFGNNVEDRLRTLGFAVFYLVGGVVASLAQVLVDPSSPTPVIGASGAIAAVMGAYLIWYPNARVNTLFFLGFIFWFRIRARWLLIAWFVLQFFTGANSNVAWVAHVAGFVFGVAVGAVLRPARPRPVSQPSW
jgi:membrane associated rhomboid family serine protease